MKIEMQEIPVREIYEGYKDNAEEGVVAYGGRLDVRPPFQREFIYKEKQRDEVIHTLRKGFPLNVMYWSKNGDSYELLDGQQRTISICQFLAGEFSIRDGNTVYFHTLSEDEKEKILDYKLMIYICDGTESEKLDWFKIINIATERLYEQELRNAVYTGPWLADAKRHFSRTGCPAYQLAGKYLSGTAIRQDYLETALKWIAARDGITLEEYMAKHRMDRDCSGLWQYFTAVIEWVERLFPKKYYRSIMKGQPWGELYNRYQEQYYDAEELEKQIKKLLLDEDVQNKKGIYPYLFTLDDNGEGGEEKLLNLRGFSEKDRLEVYEQQGGYCRKCANHFAFEEMEGDRIIPWHRGGKTTYGNLQMLCRQCRRLKNGA